jgi:hypothetical protein
MTKRTVYFELAGLKPDPEQFKPIDIAYTPTKETLIPFKIDSEFVNDDCTIIQPEGMSQIATQMAMISSRAVIDWNKERGVLSRAQNK